MTDAFTSRLQVVLLASAAHAPVMTWNSNSRFISKAGRDLVAQSLFVSMKLRGTATGRGSFLRTRQLSTSRVCLATEQISSTSTPTSSPPSTRTTSSSANSNPHPADRLGGLPKIYEVRSVLGSQTNATKLEEAAFDPDGQSSHSFSSWTLSQLISLLSSLQTT